MVKVEYNGKEWITLPSGTRNRGLYLDGKLKQKLDNVKKIQKKDWDCVGLLVGAEGSGKSTLSFIMGQYLSDMGLTINHICAGAEDAVNKLKTMPNKSILIVDEAELLFSSRETMKSEQVKLTKIMMIIRQKGMVLLLVSPSFHDLSKYIAVSRSRFVIRVYTDKKLNRGRFAYWGEKKKRTLYDLGKRNFGSYAKPKADFIGRFAEYKLPFDEDYQKTKLTSLMESFDPKKKEDSGKISKELKKKFMVEFVPPLYYKLPITTKMELSKAIGISPRTLDLYREEYKTMAFP